MIFTSNIKPRFERLIKRDYYLDSERNGKVSKLKKLSINNIMDCKKENNLLSSMDENYFNANIEYEVATDSFHMLISIIDDNSNLFGHARVYLPIENNTIALLENVYIYNEESISEVIYGKYSPLQCIYFELIDFIKGAYPHRTIIFNNDYINENIIPVLEEEQIACYDSKDLDKICEDKEYSNYEWSNTSRQRTK